MELKVKTVKHFGTQREDFLASMFPAEGELRESDSRASSPFPMGDRASSPLPMEPRASSPLPMRLGENLLDAMFPDEGELEESESRQASSSVPMRMQMSFIPKKP